MITNIQKWGNSQGVRIPKVLLEMMNWAENEQVVINTENNKIIIEKSKDKITLSKLFENYNEEYKPYKVNWGEPVGKEIW